MATTKQTLVNAGKTAVKGFSKSAIKKAFDVLATASTSNEAAISERSNAALDICRAAEKFTLANVGIDTPTIVQGWREHMQLLAMELAIAGHKFAVLQEGKEGKPARAKLVQYGQNVASYAKGVVEFGVTIDTDCTDKDGNVSYGALRKAIQEYRAEAFLAAHPDTAIINEAKEKVMAAWSMLRDAVFASENLEVIQSLERLLLDAKAEQVDAIATDEPEVIEQVA